MIDTKLIVGNWKMNNLLKDTIVLTSGLVEMVADIKGKQFKMVLCPPAVLIPEVHKIVENSDILVGGQNCHQEKSGAHTGSISAEMLKDAGCDYVIVGHSERRENDREISETVAQKAKTAHEAGLVAIICVGEQERERNSGHQNDVIAVQLDESIPKTANEKNTVIAYEPVWAIGTGKTASDDDIKDMHQFIRETLVEKMKNSNDVSILYGGSVKPMNAEEILHIPNVDGVLVGGASLKAKDFGDIASAC